MGIYLVSATLLPHLQPAHVVGLARHGDGRDLCADLARGDVALVDAEVARVLVRDGDLAAVLAELEVAGEETARGGELDPGELAVGRGLEGGDGVGVDLGAVLGVDVGHLREGDVAVGGDQELVVGGDGDLGGRAVLGDGRVGVGAVGRLLVDLLEGEAAGADVGDLVGDDLGDELVDHEEVRLGTGLPEGGVAGSVAGGGLEVGVLDELAGGAIDAEDVCGIEAEVREDHVLASGVEDRVVDVRAVGLLRLGTNGLALVANVLEELESAVLDAEGGKTMATVVSNGKVLVVVVQLSRHGATARNVDECRVLDAAVLVEGKGVEARVVGCVPGLVFLRAPFVKSSVSR